MPNVTVTTTGPPANVDQRSPVIHLAGVRQSNAKWMPTVLKIEPASTSAASILAQTLQILPVRQMRSAMYAITQPDADVPTICQLEIR